jgi:hypothetical protein
MKHVSLLSRLSGEDGTALLHKLQLIASMLLNKNAISCALNTLPETEGRLTTEAARFFARFYGSTSAHVPAGSGRSAGGDFQQLTDQKLHHIVSFPINFTAMSVPTVPYTHVDYAPLRYSM